MLARFVSDRSLSGANVPNKFLSQNNTTGQHIKASPGVLTMLYCTNINAAMRYVKLYNKATAPSVGTDTPTHTIGVPGNSSGGGICLPIPIDGILFTAGIGLGITTGPTDADTGAPAANEVIVNWTLAPDV